MTSDDRALRAPIAAAEYPRIVPGIPPAPPGPNFNLVHVLGFSVLAMGDFVLDPSA